MPPERQQAYMAQLQAESPEIAQAVQQQQAPELPEMQGQVGNAGGQAAATAQQPAPAVNMQPMPNVLPPRRPGI
jgi:uncharacterized protein (DUF3084 family)